MIRLIQKNAVYSRSCSPIENFESSFRAFWSRNNRKFSFKYSSHLSIVLIRKLSRSGLCKRQIIANIVVLQYKSIEKWVPNSSYADFLPASIFAVGCVTRSISDQWLLWRVQWSRKMAHSRSDVIATETEVYLDGSFALSHRRVYSKIL